MMNDDTEYSKQTDSVVCEKGKSLTITLRKVFCQNNNINKGDQIYIRVLQIIPKKKKK